MLTARTTQNLSRAAALAALGVGLATLVGCAAFGPPETERTLYELEDRVLRYKGPDFDIVVSTTPATLAVYDVQWVPLEVAIAGVRRGLLEIDREDFSLLTPAGEVYPLASQRELVDNYNEIDTLMRRADVGGSPIEYRVGNKDYGRLPFFAEPIVDPRRRTTASDSVFINDRTYLQGNLYFRLERFVQPGQYALIVETKNDRAEIPFTIPERE